MEYKDIDSVRKEINTNPTEKQKEAGNYKKGHIHFGGFEITIENPKGSYRRGKDRNGREWKTLMHNDYGYFTKTVGKDGDAVDVFLGPNLDSKKIFPIDQYKGEDFDETKVMLGFNSKEEAKAAYLSNYEKNWKGFRYITEVDINTFKRWLYDGRRQRKPFAKYAWLNESLLSERKNDEGQEVPKTCECGGKVCIQIHGEPIFICDKCGKYYGTVPFVRENFDVSKALKQLKKRRDPANIENWDKNMINEDFSSRILAKLAKEHGGIKISNNGGVRTFPCAFIYGHSVNPSEITDDMIVGEPFEDSPYGNSDNAVIFNDGMAIALRKDSELSRYSGDRKLARFRSGIGDTGDHDKTPDGFTGNEKKAVSAPYNGWQSSDRAGYSQSLRNAYKVNKEMGDTKTVDKIKAKARDLVAENKGRKIYLSESQFKSYCRLILREKRNEDYAKNLLREMAYGEADDIHGILQKSKEYFKSTLDYLNNEGVMDYDFNVLRKKVNDMSSINFMDLCKTTLYEWGNKMPENVKAQLERYIKTGSYPELEDTIMQAVREYVENGEQQGWMM